MKNKITRLVVCGLCAYPVDQDATVVAVSVLHPEGVPCCESCAQHFEGLLGLAPMGWRVLSRATVVGWNSTPTIH